MVIVVVIVNARRELDEELGGRRRKRDPKDQLKNDGLNTEGVSEDEGPGKFHQE